MAVPQAKGRAAAARSDNAPRNGDTMTRRRVLLGLLLGALVAAYFAFDLRQYVSLDFFQARRSAIEAYVTAAPVRAAALFFLVYVLVTGLSVPGAAVLTLIAGALFGTLAGTLIVSFASSIGATLAFVVSRFVLRDWVQSKFGERLKTINDGFAKEGALYLFALRLVPAFPFFVINLVMGLTPMRTRTFYWVSQLGMLPGTLIYVYAGTQLGQFQIGWELVLALVLLGVFPLAAKRALEGLRARKAYARMD
jgi:uncharacterized membrane protein YdjX (TVP38/TMEM64 family)